MTGGTVQNTATGANSNAITATNTGTMTISGGTVTATSGYAVRLRNLGTGSVSLILDNSPAIRGKIQADIGNFTLGASFSTTDTYNIEPIKYMSGIAVKNGANFFSYFNFVSLPSFFSVEVSGNDIVLVPVFNYTKIGTTYTITIGDAGDGAGYPNAQSTVDAIKANAAGAACTIQFGNGADVLDIFDNNIDFNNTGGTWGAISLKGKIQSTSTTATANGIIVINGNISITSEADITKSSSTSETQRAIYFNSSGTLTIDSGTVSGTSTIYNYSTGTVNISGGTFSVTTGYAVYNYGAGTVNISGGTFSATTGTTVYNYGAGTVNISGGTVSATTGTAVLNSGAGKINISQDAGKTTRIYSANTTATQGTIRITGANGELTITGGTVENTSVNAATRNTIYISIASAKASITGGIISTASTSGNYAVNNTQAGNAANIKVDPACIPAGNNCINVTAP
jgi:hypothetical protein